MSIKSEIKNIKNLLGTIEKPENKVIYFVTPTGKIYCQDLRKPEKKEPKDRYGMKCCLYVFEGESNNIKPDFDNFKDFKNHYSDVELINDYENMQEYEKHIKGMFNIG